MKAILMSIKPKWCEKIFSGEKTIEVRKSAPKEVPFKAYLYCTNGRFDITDIDDLTSDSVRVVSEGRGKVIGEFVCDKVIKTCGWRLRGNTGWCAKRTETEEKFPTLACLTIDEIVEYAGGEGREVSGWHISELKIYDTPRELGEFWSVRCTNKTGDCEKCEVKPACINNITRPPQSWCYLGEVVE